MKQLLFMVMAVFFVSSAFAGAEVKSEKMAELSATDDGEIWELASMTCGDVFDLFEDATPADKKDPEEVMAAQDDVLGLLTWVHGYLSGRDGINAGKYTLNKDGINKTVENIAKVCKENEDKLFLDLAPTIK